MEADPEVIYLLEEINDNIGSGGAFTQVEVSADYTASDNESIWVDASATPVTITLPAPAEDVHVRVVVIDGTNDVEVAPNAGEPINGVVANVPLDESEGVTLESGGSDWRVLDPIRIDVQPTAPSNPTVGDIWVDTSP